MEMEDSLSRALSFLDDPTLEAFEHDPRVMKLMWLYAQAKWNPYKVLGITSTSRRDIVKRAYEEKAWANHPDRGGKTEVMQEINIAYGVICKGRGWVK